ncbi:Lrp/AsnC ligand binding domain-containing protein [Acidobacteriia bacterium AH_259_A11_L15]|nr:Lrp/AsnC ligand binding domain-containing protein [Acidobacteriia bacterium AH_259_A11_L15]
MRAYVLVNVAPGKVQEVIRKLSRLRGVKAADACWGVPDVFVAVEVAEENELSKLVIQEIQGIEGIEKTDTHIVIPEAWFL